MPDNSPMMNSNPKQRTKRGVLEQAKPFRSGLAAIIGRANVGKSTLLNKLVGEKLSIVSPKPHTTRHRMLGVLNGERFQVGLVDTPGYLAKGRDRLDAAMASQLREALAEADLVVLVVEPRLPGAIERNFITQLQQSGTPALLVINKVDVVAKSSLLPVMEAYAAAHPFLEVIPVSSLKEEGLELLVSLLAAHLPEQSALFPPETLTDKPLPFLLGEAIREQVYIQYAMEVPYAVAIEVEQFEEREDGRPDYIQATIYVDKPSQRRLLIGKDGNALKEVGTKARQEIEKLVGRPVFLDLWVKVNPKWRTDPRFLQHVL